VRFLWPEKKSADFANGQLKYIRISTRCSTLFPLRLTALDFKTGFILVSGKPKQKTGATTDWPAAFYIMVSFKKEQFLK